MQSTPLVSVIIPNYNHAKYLAKRIDSVLEQTYQNLEILILDDCSLDNSRSIIDEYAELDKRIQTVYNSRNSGSTFKQWSKGFNLSTGKYIWIAESDDYADIHLLEKLVGKLEADDTVGLAYCDSWFVYEDKQSIERYPDFYVGMDAELWTKDFVLPGIELVRRFMSFRNIIPNASAVVLRRLVVNQVAPPDGKRKLVGDWLYWASILAVSKVAFIAEPLNYFRFHDNNVRSRSDKNGLAMLETITMLKTMRQYGPPDEALSTKMVDSLKSWWLFANYDYDTRLTLKQNYQIYSAFSELDTGFSKQFRKDSINFLFGNNFSGFRQILGDGLIYPLLKKIKKK